MEQTFLILQVERLAVCNMTNLEVLQPLIKSLTQASEKEFILIHFPSRFSSYQSVVNQQN